MTYGDTYVALSSFIISYLLSITKYTSHAYHSAPEQWPSEKKTSTPKINPNESVLQLYIDI